MAEVFARLRIGFAVRPTDRFVTTWTNADRNAFKDQLTEVILGTPTLEPSIPTKFWDAWDRVRLAVDAGGHTSESNVRATLEAELQAVNADAESVYTYRLPPASAGDPNAGLLGVTYVWSGGVRVCLHYYQLQWDLKASPQGFAPWAETFPTDPAKQQSFSVFAEFSWPTSV